MTPYQVLLLAALGVVANGRLHASIRAHNATAANASVKVAAPKNATKNATVAKAHLKPKNLTAAEQLASLSQGLQSISKLRAVFTASDTGISTDQTKLENFAQGAMTTELSSKNSKVWSTIQAMLEATQGVYKGMQNKSKADQEKMMDGLEKNLNNEALTLRNVTEKAGKIQEQHSEEYLLGVLMQHQKDWTFEKQLNVTHGFVENCAAAKELYKHHNASAPLAPQLAELMDAKKARKSGKVVAEKAAAKLFIQLVDSLHLSRA